MIVRVYEDRIWAGQYDVLVSETHIPNVSGTYTANSDYFLAQSDRCYSFPADDDRAWAYNVGMYVQTNITLTVTGTKIDVTVNDWETWKVKRNQGQTPAGYAVVQGNYSWYSSFNSAEIAHYIGPETSGQGDAEWSGAGGTHTFSTGTLKPQQSSSPVEFGNFLNHVNNNRSTAKIVFFNDFPPDYRPGKVRDNNNTWQSHNRTAGKANIRGINGWMEMRTEMGGEESNNPPKIRHQSGMKNMREIGEQ